MSPPVSDRTRSLLARSFPLVQQRADLLIEHMERSLGATAEPGEPIGQSELIAMMLVELLLRQAKHLVESGEMRGLADVAGEHEALCITGRHYSRFGDALVPIIRDLLGPTVPREVAGAWCDTFWAVISAAQPAEGVA
jgi:hemoglobin-like flavoprotein